MLKNIVRRRRDTQTVAAGDRERGDTAEERGRGRERQRQREREFTCRLSVLFPYRERRGGGRASRTSRTKSDLDRATSDGRGWIERGPGLNRTTIACSVNEGTITDSPSEMCMTGGRRGLVNMLPVDENCSSPAGEDWFIAC